jgi:hypothetical protein
MFSDEITGRDDRLTGVFGTGVDVGKLSDIWVETDTGAVVCEVAQLTKNSNAVEMKRNILSIIYL